MTSNLTTMIARNNSRQEHFGEVEFRIKYAVTANSTLTKNNFSFPTDLYFPLGLHDTHENYFVPTLTK
jgi:hypothetical protein